jgi:hypothetical protein
VDVVGHQTEQVKAYVKSSQALSQGIEEAITILVRVEDVAMMVSPQSHVVHGTFILYADRPSQVGKI